MFKASVLGTLLLFAGLWETPWNSEAQAQGGSSGGVKLKSDQVHPTGLLWKKREFVCHIRGNKLIKVGLIKRGAAAKKNVVFHPVKKVLQSLPSPKGLKSRAKSRARAARKTLKTLSRQAKSVCLEVARVGRDGSGQSESGASSSSQSSIAPLPPPNPDSDGDGLPDAWELHYFGNLAQGAFNDPDQDWRTNMEEYLAGTDPTRPDTGVKNPGFEEGLGADGRPLHWSKYYSSGGTQALDSHNPHSGSYSWKLTRIPNAQGESGYYTGWSEPIPVVPGRRYILKAFVRTQTGEEGIKLGWDEYSDAAGTQYINTSYFVANPLSMPVQWSMLTSAPRRAPASAASVRVRFTVVSDGLEPRSAWFDDFSVIEIGAQHLPAAGCQNSASARCIDFGAAGEHGHGYNQGAMGEAKQEGAISYRELLPLATLNLAFDPFEVDGDGFPVSPLLLEIRFKDTIDGLLYGSSAKTEHRVEVSSRADFRNLDPAYEQSSSEYYRQVGALGHDNDQQWKYWQYSFAKSPYQLIRAVDGKLRLRIRMPNKGPEDAELHFPIDYISLRQISEADHQAFTERERLYGGFFEVDLPPDHPVIEPNYPDPRLTLFSRDLMRPIFPHTRPAQEEITGQIGVKTAAGEIATMALGLYSEQGIAGLSFEPGALSQPGGSVIPAEDIELLKVVPKEARLHIYRDERFALSPDHLRPLGVLSLPPQTSAGVWIKVQVPPGASGSYAGVLNIRSGVELIESINLKLEVIPVLLDDSSHMNPVWVDPWLSSAVPNESLDVVLKLFRQTGLDPFLYCSISPIKTGDQITGFNTDKLERLIDRSLSSHNGYGSRRFTLWISGMPSVIYNAVHGPSTLCSNYDLYQRLSAPQYQSAFFAAIVKYLEVASAKGISVQFFMQDEPNDKPCSRIIADRLYPLIKAAGGVTTVTYSPLADQPVSIPAELYSVPNQQLPAMTALIDHKLWWPTRAGDGYQLTQSGEGYYPYFGFYTTGPGSVRNPVYNRFMHGLYAVRTNASSVHAYAMSSYVVDPHNDFDRFPSAVGVWTYPDFLLAYPTWNEGLWPTLGVEGIRLGIQDAKYIATLQRLIAQHPGNPAATRAQDFLAETFSKLGTDLFGDYFSAPPNYRDGAYQHVLRALSETEGSYDFEAFSAVREKVIEHIAELAEIS